MKEKDIKKEIRRIDRMLETIPAKKRLLQIKKWLSINFPSKRKVRVRTSKRRDYMYGCTELSKGVFTIYINTKFSKREQRDTLIHEWAHVISWGKDRIKKSYHSDKFGLAYIRIYRKWIDEYGFLHSVGIDTNKMTEKFRRKIDEELF